MNPVKAKRQAISLERKIQILDLLASGQGATSVGKRFGLNEATVRTIKKNEAAIRKSVGAGTKISVNSSSYTRDIVTEKMEKAVMKWIEDKSRKRVPVEMNEIKQTALNLYHQIKEKEHSVSSHRKYEFSASTGWMRGFLKRHQAFRNAKVKGETGSANQSAAKAFKQQLAKIIKAGGYAPDQVWNAEECGLSWKRMPIRSCVAKSQSDAMGFKVAKDQVTLLFCSNASGDCVLKPLLVNRALKPRSMKGIDLNTLAVHWMANKDAWVTAAIFSEWFYKCFIEEVARYLNAKGLEFKVLLILDYAFSEHPVIQHPNVLIVFLPPNTAALIQPLDQGVIATYKTHYVKRTFQYILDKLSNETLTVIDAWKTFSIVDCVHHVGSALSELKPATLNACWKAIWPQCVKSKGPIAPNTSEFPQIVELARAIGGEGFQDLTFEEIEELVVDKASNHDWSVNADLLKEGLELAEELGHHFVKHDPDRERAGKFQRELMTLTASYAELYKELTKTET